MAIQSLRGFRDFYPEEQQKINYLRTKIAEVCNLFGYEKFEGPALEPFELYAAKSSDEIVNEQAFVFADRGGEKIALRPELTPTLARMVAKRQSQLAFPLRWWSFGRFWRYERPQKGRGREFYQWNCDILGGDSLHAQAEILEIIITFLQSLGLTAADCVIELSHRGLATQLLTQKGLSNEQIKPAFAFLDKLPKLDSSAQLECAKQFGLPPDSIETFHALTADSTLWKNHPEFNELMNRLQERGLSDWVTPNLSVVRGFTYYTGFVFEVSDRAKAFRALLGGGQYENLVAQVGGEPVPGIGFGMGDMVLLSLLERHNLLPTYLPPAKVCVVGLGTDTLEYCQSVADELRQAQIATLFYGITNNLSHGLKHANQKHIPYVVLIGPDELANQTVTLKKLETSEQTTIPRSGILQVIM